MINALQVDTGRQMQGGQWQVLYLMERLRGAKLLAPRKSILFGLAQKRGLDVEALSLAALMRLARQADLVHVHDARAHTLAALARVSRLVVSRRVAFPIHRSMASQWKYSRAEMYLAVSQFVTARLIEAGIDDSRIRVIHDGVPLPALTSREPGRVVAPANKAPDISGIPLQLSTNLWQDLSTASVFVYVSDLEGLGSGVLAAMAAGVPVVASGAGGLSESIQHECTGLLVRRDEIAGAVRRLLDDPQSAEQMGMRGRKRIEEMFTADRMAAETMRVYEELLKVRAC